LIELEDYQQPKSFNILLIGESCVDEYRYGMCRRISPEAPIPVFEYGQTKRTLGMARNVEFNLAALGANVTIITNNPEKIIKRRFVDEASGQMILREDVEGYVPVANTSGLDTSRYNAIVVSDYNKGLIHPPHMVNLIKHFNGPVYVDTKNPEIGHYNHCTIKMNDSEYNSVTQWPWDCGIVVTRGAGGASWNSISYPAPPVDVFDVTGAGDVFLATMAYFDLVFTDLPMAIKMAVSLASKSVTHRGTYRITQEDINDSYQQL